MYKPKFNIGDVVSKYRDEDDSIISGLVTKHGRITYQIYWFHNEKLFFPEEEEGVKHYTFAWYDERYEKIA